MAKGAATAGELLHQARRLAGLSQAELAQRAGIAQSVVSVYESGRRQPALSTLEGLIAATGHDLHVEVREPDSGLERLTGILGRRVKDARYRLTKAADSYGATGLTVFGSVARGEETADSDVDLLVQPPLDMGLLGLARLQRDLETILEARVDLVPLDDLKPAVYQSVVAEMIVL